MTPFNSEQFKAGRIAIARSGDEYRFVAYIEGSRWPIVTHCVKHDITSLLTIDGYFNDGSSQLDYRDLVSMKPEKREYWRMVYKNHIGTPCVGLSNYPSKQEADEVPVNEIYTRLPSVKVYEEEV